jgi:hypothetical protein
VRFAVWIPERTGIVSSAIPKQRPSRIPRTQSAAAPAAATRAIEIRSAASGGTSANGRKRNDANGRYTHAVRVASASNVGVG